MQRSAEISLCKSIILYPCNAILTILYVKWRCVEGLMQTATQWSLSQKWHIPLKIKKTNYVFSLPVTDTIMKSVFFVNIPCSSRTTNAMIVIILCQSGQGSDRAKHENTALWRIHDFKCGIRYGFIFKNRLRRIFCLMKCQKNFFFFVYRGEEGSIFPAIT